MSRLLCTLLVFMLWLGTAAARESRMSFEIDKSAQHAATRHARDLVVFAQSELNLKLDWSDASVRHVEELAGSLHADFRRQRASAADIAPLVTMIGSYLGEVLRRNHGAQWGWVSVNGHRVLGLKAEQTGALFTPIETAKRRVHHGASSNLWRTYQVKAGS